MRVSNIVFSFLCIFCFWQRMEAGTTSEVFAKYPNKYFIETGSFSGDGIQMALEVGFKIIYSVELSPYLHEYCSQRFISYPNITLLQGASEDVLPQLLQRIDAPATFWLDGHYSEGITAKGITNSPILAELESIRQHPIKSHTILIDDVRLFGTESFDFVTLEEIVLKVLEINPNYVISFEHGHVLNDVLVAQSIQKSVSGKTKKLRKKRMCKYGKRKYEPTGINPTFAFFR